MKQTESNGLSTLTKINVEWLSQEIAKHVDVEKVSFSPCQWAILSVYIVFDPAEINVNCFVLYG